MLVSACLLLYFHFTSRRKIFLMWTCFLAVKCKVREQEELGEMTPWSCGTVNSSPNSSTPCNLQDAGRAVLLCSVTLRVLHLEGWMEEGRWVEQSKGQRDREKSMLCLWCTVFWLYHALLTFIVLGENHLSSYFGKDRLSSLIDHSIFWYLCSKILSKCKCLLSSFSSGRTPQQDRSMMTSSGLSLIWQTTLSFICPSFVG